MSHGDFSQRYENNITYNWEDEVEATPADELGSIDRKKVDDKIIHHAKDNTLMNFYKKGDDKNFNEFRTKKNFIQLHEHIKTSNKSHHHSNSQYNFEKCKIFAKYVI